MNKEIWKPIKDFPHYEISNYGNIRRKYKSGKTRKLKVAYDKNKYYIVTLSEQNKKTTKRVNVLVAKTFISNPNNFPVVNHINGIKTDNNVNNLEWCSYSYNTKEEYKMGLCKPTRYFLGKLGKESSKAKIIIQKDENDNIINYYYGCLEAYRKTNINYRNINACCNGKRKTAGGYKWNYLESRGIEIL